MNIQKLLLIAKFTLFIGITFLFEENSLAESVSIIKDNGISVSLSKVKKANCIVNIKADNLEFQKVSKNTKQNRFIINLRGISFSKSHIVTPSICSIAKVRVYQKQHTAQVILEMKKNIDPTYSFSKNEDSFNLILLNLRAKKDIEGDPTLAETNLTDETPTTSETTIITESPSLSNTEETIINDEVSTSISEAPTISEEASVTKSEISTASETPSSSEEINVTTSEVPTISEEASTTISESPAPSNTEEEIISEEVTDTVSESPLPSNSEEETLLEEVTTTASGTPSINETPKTSSTPIITESPIPSASEDEIKEDTESKEETSSEDNTVKSQDTSSTQLKKINFEFVEDSAPAIVLTLTQRSHFTFQQKNEGQYSLIVPNINIDKEHLLLPYFAPQDFAPFISFIAKNSSEGIEIEITADKKISLTAIPADNKIIVTEE